MAEYHVCASADNVTLTPTLAYLEEFLHSHPKQGMHDQLELSHSHPLRSVTHLYCQLYSDSHGLKLTQHIAVVGTQLVNCLHLCKHEHYAETETVLMT